MPAYDSGAYEIFQSMSTPQIDLRSYAENPQVVDSEWRYLEFAVALCALYRCI